jgi:hypothetical protein
MKLFKEYTFHWWEFGLLKISLIALGVLAGSHWAYIFNSKAITLLLVVIFVIPSVYLMIATLKQAKS